MKGVYFLFVYLVAVILLSSLAECRSGRVKRRIDEFAKMIQFTTTRNPMDFNGYGNWCGFGGKGVTVDAIDKCCEIHDKCYMHLNRDECKTLLKYKVYTREYQWIYKNKVITCKDTDVCSKHLCECDRAAAICFGENDHVYDVHNKHSPFLKSLSTKLMKNL